MSSDQEIYAKINNEIYVAPIGFLDVERFKDYVVDNVIDIDAMSALELKKRFEVKDRLFGYICNSLVCIHGYDNPGYNEELDKICGRIDMESRAINYLKEIGKYDEALKRMDRFMTTMLSFSTRMFSKQR